MIEAKLIIRAADGFRDAIIFTVALATAILTCTVY